MTQYLIILTGAVLVNNYVLAQFLGICPFLGVSKKLDSAVGMSIAVIFVMALATATTWPIYTFILVPAGLAWLQTIVFILIIAALVQFIEIVLKKYIPSLHAALGIYLPLITTNCAVLGVTMVLFSGVRSRVDATDNIPKAYQGVAITLTAASICSLSFMGFTGIVDGLFK